MAKLTTPIRRYFNARFEAVVQDLRATRAELAEAATTLRAMQEDLTRATKAVAEAQTAAAERHEHVLQAVAVLGRTVENGQEQARLLADDILRGTSGGCGTPVA